MGWKWNFGLSLRQEAMPWKGHSFTPGWKRTPTNPLSQSDPRISAMQIQSSAYGLPIQIVFGKNRISPNLIWYGDFQAIANTSSTSAGGKGGGGVKQESTTYTYQTAVALGLCEGPITSIGTIWAGKKQTTATDANFTTFTGTYPQSAWGYLTTNHPTEAIGYQGLSYLANGSLALGSSAELPNFTVEVVGLNPYSPAANIYDANPADVVTSILTSSHFGAGFPSANLGNLTAYSNFCVANGIFLSPVLDRQASALQTLREIADATNTALVWSEGLLKFIPRGDQTVTANGVTFTPDISVQYDLTDDDFLSDGSDDPVTVMRKTPAEMFNQVRVEFLNRTNQYNIEIAEAKDQANIEAVGLRSSDVVKMHSICSPDTARAVAQFLLQRDLYILNAFSFRLGARFSRLEPMDIVTLTDVALGLNRLQVRITEIVEGEDGNLEITADEFPFGVSQQAIYSTQSGLGYNANYNSDPGNCNAPVFLEAPLQISNGNLELWITASGGPTWGGAEVWVSRDNATYQRIDKLTSGARTGTGTLTTGTDPDTTHTLAVDLTESRGQLLSGTQSDADNFTTLCQIGNELVSYKTATLTGSYTYDLTALRRGVYDSTIGTHSAGSRFARVDQTAAKIPYAAADVGATLWIKFASFNHFSGGLQTLDGLTPYLYTITGSPLAGDLADVTGLTSNYIAGTTFLRWDEVTDALRPVKYEIRKGTSWESGQVVAITPVTYWPALGDGEYWVSARSDVAGITAYSNTPVSVTIVGTLITSNIIATYDEAASGWSGTRSGEIIIISNELALRGAGDILAVSDILALTDVLYYGGVEAEGTYEIPAGHIVNVGRVVPCNILVTYTAFGQSLTEDFYSIADLFAQTDLYNSALGQFVSVTPQVAVAGADAVFGPWQNYAPGAYSGQYFKSRLVIDSLDPTVQPRVSAYTFAVDVPDRTDAGTNVNVGTGGLTVTYVTPFNGGPGAAAAPNVQVTILNASAGDDVVLNPSTTSGFTVVIKNGGSNVSRNINWIARGY